MKGTNAYVAQREDIVTLWPFCQATVRGQFVMEPPHANPAQPTSTGATTWRTRS